MKKVLVVLLSVIALNVYAVTALSDESGIGTLNTIIDTKFEGSLPAFIAAFTSTKKLTKKEIEELRKIIEK